MERGVRMRGPYLLYRAAECGKLQFMALALAEGVDINATEKARARTRALASNAEQKRASGLLLAEALRGAETQRARR
jgi:hypothetical protein